jgi:hypothetical protein
MNEMWRVVVVVVAVVTGIGCGTPPSACTPGATQACACGGGATGAQTCNAAGTGFGPCTNCGGAPAPDAATLSPDAAAPADAPPAAPPLAAAWRARTLTDADRASGIVAIDAALALAADGTFVERLAVRYSSATASGCSVGIDAAGGWTADARTLTLAPAGGVIRETRSGCTDPRLDTPGETRAWGAQAAYRYALGGTAVAPTLALVQISLADDYLNRVFDRQ